ncbi:MAG: DUF4386 domain-containing protein [Candidatus Thorarchaeota archaeon]
MTNRINVIWQRNPARIAGLFYLILTVLCFVGAIRFFPLAGVPVNLADSCIFIARIGFLCDLMMTMFFLLLAWALYVLFSPVNKNLALLVTLSISVSVAIQAVNAINYYAALSLLSGADYMGVFQVDQIQALAMFYLEMNTMVTHIAEVFWFLWLLPAGYLIYTSDILPRNLGILMMIGSFGYLLVLIQFFLFPSYEMISIPGALVAGIAELSLMAWLLVKGAKPLENQDL